MHLEKNEIKKKLSSQWENLNIYIYDEVSSTNDLAKDYAKENTETPALFITKKQTKGRGRQGRSFYSSIDNGLYFSLVIHPGKIQQKYIPIYTVLTATAVLQAVKKNFNIDLKVKWVNDLFFKNRKVSGILCESVMNYKKQTITSVIIGVGINLSGNFEQANSETQKVAGTLFDSLPENTNLNMFLADFLSFFLGYYKDFPRNSFLEIYDKHLLGKGKEVFYIKEGHTKKGIISGLNQQGNLLIRLPNGKIESLLGQDIHFSSQQFL